MDVGVVSASFPAPLKNPTPTQPRRSRAASATVSSSRSPSHHHPAPISKPEAPAGRGAAGQGFEPRCPRRGPPTGAPEPRRPQTRAGATMLTHAAALAGRARPRGLFWAPAQARRGGASIRPRRAAHAAAHARPPPRPRQAGRQAGASERRPRLRTLRASAAVPGVAFRPPPRHRPDLLPGQPAPHPLPSGGRARHAPDPAGESAEPVRGRVGNPAGTKSRENENGLGFFCFFFFPSPSSRATPPVAPARAPPGLPPPVPGAVTSRRGRAPPSSRCGGAARHSVSRRRRAPRRPWRRVPDGTSAKGAWVAPLSLLQRCSLWEI